MGWLLNNANHTKLQKKKTPKIWIKVFYGDTLKLKLTIKTCKFQFYFKNIRLISTLKILSIFYSNSNYLYINIQLNSCR